MQRGVGVIYLVIGVLLLGVVVAFLLGRNSATQSPQQVACTLEAKVCPDGSTVGRSGPKCEFAACPAPSDSTANWKTYSNIYGFSFKYPETTIIKDVSSGDIIQILIKPQDKQDYSLQVRPVDSNFDVEFLLDQPSNGERQIGDIKWKTYLLKDGYGDGPIAPTGPLYGLRTLNRNSGYTFMFNNQDNINSEQEKVISTLKFN